MNSNSRNDQSRENNSKIIFSVEKLEELKLPSFSFDIYFYKDWNNKQPFVYQKDLIIKTIHIQIAFNLEIRDIPNANVYELHVIDEIESNNFVREYKDFKITVSLRYDSKLTKKLANTKFAIQLGINKSY